MRCIDASTLFSVLANPLPPSFLDTCSPSTSSPGCNALCMVISFLVLWSICLSSSLVHFRKGPEYLTRGIVQVFVPLIRFRQESFFSSIFLVLLRYSFWILSFISTFIIIIIIASFSHHCQLMVSHWSLSNSKSPQVFKTFQRILPEFNTAAVWMVSILPPISCSSSLFQSFGYRSKLYSLFVSPSPSCFKVCFF